MITFKILIFAILSGVLGLPESAPTTDKNLLENDQTTKEKRSLESFVSPEGEQYNEHNVLYNDDSPYGDGFFGFELFRQFFEKSGTVLGPLSKLFETFSYSKVRGDLMLLRRFLNIIIRLATLINSFLPVPEVSNAAMEEFSKLYPGTSITVDKNEGLTDIPEKPESVYDYVTKKPGINEQKDLSEDDIIKELSKIDLQRINNVNKRHQESSKPQDQHLLITNNNKNKVEDVSNENRIYFPSTSLPEKTTVSTGSLEEFIRDRNRVKRPNNVHTPPGSSEVLKTHPKIDLRSHHIFDADLSVLNKNNT